VRAITELIRNVSLVRKIRLEKVVRVGFDAMEKVIVGSVEQVGDDRHVIATVTARISQWLSCHKAQQQFARHHTRHYWQLSILPPTLARQAYPQTCSADHSLSKAHCRLHS